MGVALSHFMSRYGLGPGLPSSPSGLEDNNSNFPSSPRDRAAFAVISRLVSCLVTEQILRAFYIPLGDSGSLEDSSGKCSGFMIVFTSTTSKCEKASLPLRVDDVLLLVPLHHAPVLDGTKEAFGWKVGLVDPLDMLGLPLALAKETTTQAEPRHAAPILDAVLPLLGVFPNQDISLRNINDPIWIWRTFSKDYPINDSLRQTIEDELQSSFEWQDLAYSKPPKCPDLCSPAIEWEQSLVTGHPTHPMHRARMFKTVTLDYDWYHPKIRFARVKSEKMEILGDFSKITRQMVNTALEEAQRPLLIEKEDVYVYMPIHELQISNIQDKFDDVEILEESISFDGFAQSSIRTVEILQFPGRAFKLAVGVKISSALRTISHFTANFGPRFSRDIIPHLSIDSDILTVELETSSATYRTSNPDLAKHFTSVIREEYIPKEGEAAIVIAALLDSGHGGVREGVSAVEHAFDLVSDQAKEAFLKRYIHVACRALIPPLVSNGVAFEAHAQNMLARVDLETKELKGFVIRDLGGLRVHPPTLRQSTGVDFQFLPGHVVATSTLEEIYPKFYHTFVHNHVQRLIRLLGMHYDGRGWKILRDEMEAVIPKDHIVWKAWMNPERRTVDSKCLMRMRMKDSYRDMVYSPYPNMIQYRPQSTASIIQ